MASLPAHVRACRRAQRSLRPVLALTAPIAAAPQETQADGATGTPAAAAAATTVAAAAPLPLAHEFGWVPAEVVHALLEEVGNFRARAAAIELLHAAVLDLPSLPGGAAAVQPTLSAFLAFLLRLVADANFKIAISAMTILQDLVGQLGADLEPYLGTLAAALTERLGDNVQVGAGAGRWEAGWVRRAHCVIKQSRMTIQRCLNHVSLHSEDSPQPPSPPSPPTTTDGAAGGGARAGRAGPGCGPHTPADGAGWGPGAPLLAGAGGGRECLHSHPADTQQRAV